VKRVKLLLCVTVFCTAPCAADVENFYDPSKEKKMLQRCGRFSLPSRCALSSITTADGLIDSFASSLSLSLSSSPSSVHTITTIPSFCNRNDNNNNNNSNRNRNRNRNTATNHHHQPNRSIKTSSSHATTVLGIRKDSKTVLIADGQVTMGSEIIKHNVIKVRKLGDGVISGFAGSTADAFTLFERLEQKIEEHPGQLTRACVELAKNWRTDKYLRRLEATMIVADKHHMFQITGNGDVLEPSNGIIGIGSGGSYALAASKALVDVEGLSAMDIAKKAMDIAANTCVYTNDKFQILTLDSDASAEEEGGEKEKKEVDDGGEKGGEGKKAA
jgi:ATP-dependent HslUV protease, peptidase subunit HslV